MPKAYIGIKFHPDASNKATIASLDQALTAAGFTTICVHRDIELFGQISLTPVQLMQKTFEIIDSCQLVVIELSEKGVGLGIEAGYAFAHEIPIATVVQKGADISNTLRGVSREVFEYESYEDLSGFFRQVRSWYPVK